MGINFLIFLASLAVVLLGARWFLSASVYLAKLLRIQEMIIGATIVSLATTSPETLVSIFGSATGHSSLALGNILGSGAVNLGLLLGLILLVGGKHDEAAERGKRRSLILFFLILFIFLWFLFLGQIDLFGGLILIFLSFAFLGYTFWYALRGSGDSLLFIENKIETHLNIIFKFLAGVLLLIVGARFLVESGADLSIMLGLPEIIIGLTLVALGTSLPELLTFVIAVRSGHAKISLGNLTGATIITFTLALGLAAMIAPVSLPRSAIILDFPFLFFFSLLSVIFAFFPKVPQKLVGGLLLTGYLSYFILIWL